MSHVTITEWRSLDTLSVLPWSSEDFRFLIAGFDRIVPTTSFTVARNFGSSTVLVELCTSTSSVCGSTCGNAFLRIWSPLWDWPTLLSSVLRVLVPTCMPMAIARTTNASQPKTAVFQWLALQRPMRAAMLFERFRGDIWTLLLRLGMSPRSQRDVEAGMRLAGLFRAENRTRRGGNGA